MPLFLISLTSIFVRPFPDHASHNHHSARVLLPLFPRQLPSDLFLAVPGFCSSLFRALPNLLGFRQSFCNPFPSHFLISLIDLPCTRNYHTALAVHCPPDANACPHIS